MKKKLLLLLLCITLFFVPATSQSQTDYEKAIILATEASKQLSSGDLRLADSLIKQSVSVYPTVAIYDYAYTLAELSDIEGSNQVMELVRKRVLEFKEKQLIMKIPGRGTFPCNKQYAYFGFLLRSYEVNKIFGDRKLIMNSLELATKVSFVPLASYQDDYYVTMQQLLRIEYLRMQKKYAEAINLINSMPPLRSNESIKSYTVTKAELQIPIFVEMGDFQRATYNVSLLNIDPQLVIAQTSWMFYISAMMYDSKQAMSYYAMLPQSMVQANLNAYYYVLGIIKNNSKNYDEAIHDLQLAISDNAKKNVAAIWLVEKWKTYTALGDAYAGANQYHKAKDNYSIALLSNPGYEPAVTGLAKLEADYSAAKLVDQTAPIITLFEPSPSRGLIVTTASSSVMIKGMASDPSGITKVSINDVEVYTQSSGDFWGEIVLKEGINKVVVSATDAVGNKKQQIFEIEKKFGENNIAEMPVKEGKNYALLIAAQYYTDDNISSLDNPVADAVKLKLILKNNYNYADGNIITLYNPEVNDVKRQLLELSNTIQPEDNLVIFYAGHGIWVEKEKKGYWLLTDSKGKDPKTWLPNKDVLDLIAKLPSRHTLLITDACFSGSVFKTRNFDPTAPVAIQNMNEKISRVAITSGNDTEVPDKSVVMKYLVKALSENKEKYLTAQKMFINQIIEAVMTETKTEPRYGTLELAGHVGGDFIFIKK